MRNTLLFLLTAALSLFAADLTGTWKGHVTPDGSSETTPVVLTLKDEGGKLSGTVTGDGEAVQITNAKLEKDDFSFEIITDNSKFNVAMKIDGEAMKGKVTREREGQTRSYDISVKREK